jgi:hypothetical protein
MSGRRQLAAGIHQVDHRRKILERFVQQDDFWIADQGPCDRQHLLLTRSSGHRLRAVSPASTRFFSTLRLLDSIPRSLSTSSLIRPDINFSLHALCVWGRRYFSGMAAV